MHVQTISVPTEGSHVPSSSPFSHFNGIHCLASSRKLVLCLLLHSTGPWHSVVFCIWLLLQLWDSVMQRCIAVAHSLSSLWRILFEYTTIYMSILLLMNIWVSSFWLFWIKLLKTFLCMNFPPNSWALFLVGYRPRNAGWVMGRHTFTFRRYCQAVFPSGWAYVLSHQ